MISLPVPPCGVCGNTDYTKGDKPGQIRCVHCGAITTVELFGAGVK